MSHNTAPTDYNFDNPYYAGFNEYNHAYDIENAYEDQAFVQAVARSSHGRRPKTGTKAYQQGNSQLERPPTAAFQLMMQQSSMGIKRTAPSASGRQLAPHSALGTRITTGTSSEIINRPMTAARGAGYSAPGRKSTFDTGIDTSTMGSYLSPEESAMEKLKKLEEVINEQLVESIMAHDEKNYKKALSQAKEAARKFQSTESMRKNHALDSNNDLYTIVYLTLAQMKIANNTSIEALEAYSALTKDKSSANSGRLKINMGNIYFRKKDFPNALKYYKMAVDQVPKNQRRVRAKILNNIGIALVKIAKYEDALLSFEECLEMHGDHQIALNLY